MLFASSRTSMFFHSRLGEEAFPVILHLANIPIFMVTKWRMAGKIDQELVWGLEGT